MGVISIVIGIINQLVTGGAPPCIYSCFFHYTITQSVLNPKARTPIFGSMHFWNLHKNTDLPNSMNTQFTGGIPYLFWPCFFADSLKKCEFSDAHLSFSRMFPNAWSKDVRPRDVSLRDIVRDPWDHGQDHGAMPWNVLAFILITPLKDL